MQFPKGLALLVSCGIRRAIQAPFVNIKTAGRQQERLMATLAPVVCTVSRRTAYTNSQRQAAATIHERAHGDESDTQGIIDDLGWRGGR